MKLLMYYLPLIFKLKANEIAAKIVHKTPEGKEEDSSDGKHLSSYIKLSIGIYNLQFFSLSQLVIFSLAIHLLKQLEGYV